MDGTRTTTYGVASDASQKDGHHYGYDHVRPTRWVHAVDVSGAALCGKDIGELLLWPGLSFDEVPEDDRCASCRSVAAAF